LFHSSTPPLVHSDAEWPPFGERLRALLVSPLATLRAAAAQIDWVRPALMMFCGMLLYTAPMGFRVGLAESGYMRQMIQQEQQRAQKQPPKPGAAPQNPLPPWFFSMFSGMGAFAAFAAMFSVIQTTVSSWFVRTAIFYGLGRAFGGMPRRFFPLFAAV